MVDNSMLFDGFVFVLWLIWGCWVGVCVCVVADLGWGCWIFGGGGGGA